jgi:hypothetical protein
MMASSTVICPSCGFVAPVKESQMGEEVILQRDNYTPYQWRQLAKDSSLEEIAAMIRAKKIKLFFVLHNIVKRESDVRELLRHCGYASGFYYKLQELHGFKWD